MANLIPEKNKKNIKKEIFRRFVVSWGVLSSLLFAIAYLAFLPSLVFTDSVFRSFKDQKQSAEILAKRENLEQLESSVNNLNGFLASYRFNQKEIKKISDFIPEIIGHLPDTLKINSFLFDMGNTPRINIYGLAENRVDLMLFIEKLEKSNNFKKVESPVSNLLTEQNIKFSLILEF